MLAGDPGQGQGPQLEEGDDLAGGVADWSKVPQDQDDPCGEQILGIHVLGGDRATLAANNNVRTKTDEGESKSRKSCKKKVSRRTY